MTSSVFALQHNSNRNMAAIRSKCSSVLNAGKNVLEYLFSSMRPGVKKLGPMTFTYGRCNQAALSGCYAGAQCTTMALAAIIQHERKTKFTPKKINKILEEGNRLHGRLREDLNLSNNADGRIGIDDFPDDGYVHLGKVFGNNVEMKLLQNCTYVFPLQKQGFEEFFTIREYLEIWRENIDCAGFLLTLKDYSYSVIFDKNGKINFFDSHGHLKLNDKFIKKKAGVLKFKNIDDFESFIVNIYGPDESAAIAPVSVKIAPGAINVAPVEAVNSVDSAEDTSGNSSSQ